MQSLTTGGAKPAAWLPASGKVVSSLLPPPAAQYYPSWKKSATSEGKVTCPPQPDKADGYKVIIQRAVRGAYRFPKAQSQAA